LVITEKMLIYKAYGFSIISEINLPELPKINEIVDSTDLEIIFEDLSKLWSELSDENHAFGIRKNIVMFEVPNVAIFSINNGNKISLSPLEEYDENLVRLYILGICMGVILMQRGILPLHGSAIAINGKAYAFVGNSGAGKSTLASCFLNQGYKFLSDDVIAISFSEENIPFVTPSYPNRKLWKESLNLLEMNTKEYQPIYGRETKYSVPVTSSYYSDPLPLGGVFEIVKKENKEIEFTKIEMLEQLYTLYYHTFQKEIIQDMGIMNWHFSKTNKIIEKNIGVYRIARPAGFNTATELVSLITSTIHKGE
jgi:hypothetical protein